MDSGAAQSAHTEHSGPTSAALAGYFSGQKRRRRCLAACTLFARSWGGGGGDWEGLLGEGVHRGGGSRPGFKGKLRPAGGDGNGGAGCGEPGGVVMHGEDPDGIVIVCDFCRRDWDGQEAMIEGHHGSVLCLECLKKGLAEQKTGARSITVRCVCGFCIPPTLPRWSHPEHSGGGGVPGSACTRRARRLVRIRMWISSLITRLIRRRGRRLFENSKE